jgi:dienelactone hydrolase
MTSFAKLAFQRRALCVKAFAFVFAFLIFIPAGNLLQAQSISPAQLERLRVRANQALFIDSPLPPLDARTFAKLPVNDNVRIEHVTFATQYGLRIPAIVYIPMHPHGKVPAIIIVNGHGGDKSSWYAVYTGLLYATSGAVVVTYDPAGEFERSATRASEAGEHDKPIPGLTHTERVGGLMIEDAQQAIRYAASRPEVDSSRIAVLGYSMGSFHTILATALAGPQLPKIHAVLLSGGGNLDGAEQYWDTGHAVNCQAAPYRALDFFPGGGDARGPILYALRARSGPTLALNGTEDSLITKFNELEPFFIDLRKRIAAVSGSQTNLPETIWYEHVGHRPSFMTRAAALWLDTQLHFPNWTHAQIEAFPTVRAIDWVTKTGVRISRGYQVEQKEGGILALDLHIPGLTREQLTAVPGDEWQKDPTLYTLPGWIPHALAAESTPSSSVQSNHP